MDWQGKKVLIAGGAGMIGSHLARELCMKDALVTIADNLSSGSKKNINDILKEYHNARFKMVDLRTPVVCRHITQNQDYVFQLAANMGGIGYITKIGADIIRDSALINLNLLDAAYQNEVKRYFYSSSACVYPEYKQTSADVVALKEEDAYPAMPDQFYGWEKLFTEKVCEAYQRDHGMEIRIARFHNIYGDGFTSYDKFKAKAPCHLIVKAINHPNPHFDIWGDGKQTRSFCYIDDCIDAILALFESDYKEPINIGTDRLVTIDELANIIIKISGKNIIPTHDLNKPVGVRGRNADLSLIKRMLGWEPKIDLEEGLEQVYSFALDNWERLENI